MSARQEWITRDRTVRVVRCPDGAVMVGDGYGGELVTVGGSTQVEEVIDLLLRATEIPAKGGAA